MGQQKQVESEVLGDPLRLKEEGNDAFKAGFEDGAVQRGEDRGV